MWCRTVLFYCHFYTTNEMITYVIVTYIIFQSRYKQGFTMTHCPIKSLCLLVTMWFITSCYLVI